MKKVTLRSLFARRNSSVRVFSLLFTFIVAVNQLFTGLNGLALAASSTGQTGDTAPVRERPVIADETVMEIVEEKMELADKPEPDPIPEPSYTLQGLINGMDPALEDSWTNGTAHKNSYPEGSDVPTRLVISDLVIGETYTIEVEHDWINKDGVVGYESFHRNDPVLPDIGASGVTIGAPVQFACDSSTCLKYVFTYTATATDAVIFWDSHLSDEAAAWTPGQSEASLHLRLSNGGSRTVPIHVDDVPELPTLTLIKTVDNGDALANQWCFDVTPAIDGQTTFCIATDGDNVDTVTIPGIPAGTYTITESAIDGYEFFYGVGTNCTFSGEEATAIVAEGDPAVDATCVFHNTEEVINPTQGRVIVEKRVIDADGLDIIDETPFTVEITDNDEFSETGTIIDSETPVTAIFELDPGTYSIDEINPDEDYDYLGCSEVAMPRFLAAQTQDVFDIEAGESVRVICTNQLLENTLPVEPLLYIAKTNDKTGIDLFAGSYVTYTIVVTADINDVNDVTVEDLMPTNFVYQSGTWTSNSSVRGDLKALGITPEPQYNSPATWELGDMEPDEVVTLTYVAFIPETQDPGLYKDIAWTQGMSTSGAVVVGNNDTYYVGTEVNVIAQAVQPAAVVLGAQTLARTGQAVIAFIVLGALAAFAGFTLAKKIKIMGFLVAVMIIGTALLPILSQKVMAGTAYPINVRIEQPESPTGLNPFYVAFGALQIQGTETLSATCLVKAPAAADFVSFDSMTLPAGGSNGNCTVDSDVLTADGIYEFKVNVGGKDSDTVSVNYYTVKPGTPVTYAKTLQDTCTYKITFTTANDNGETQAVEIHRSQLTSFTADETTLVKTVAIGSNANGEYVDTIPTCGETYYYAIRAVGPTGNYSDFLADAIVTVVVTPAPAPAPAPVPVAPEVLGEQNAEGENAENVNENGEVLGEEDITCDAKSKVSGYVFYDENGDGVWQDGEDGIEGISVGIYYTVDGAERLLTTALTNENGYWEAQVCPGDYTTKIDSVELPKNAVLSSSDTRVITVGENDELTQMNFVAEKGSVLSNISAIWFVVGAVVIIGAAMLIGYLTSRKKSKSL